MQYRHIAALVLTLGSKESELGKGILKCRLVLLVLASPGIEIEGRPRSYCSTVNHGLTLLKRTRPNYVCHVGVGGTLQHRM